MFTGREYDAETGLYYYRARYYDPSIGRFIQTDPLGYIPDINLYRYVGNNPVNWRDPQGIGAIKGAITGAIQGAATGWAQGSSNGGGWWGGLKGAAKSGVSGAASGFVSGFVKNPLGSTAVGEFVGGLLDPTELGEDDMVPDDNISLPPPTPEGKSGECN